MQEPFFLLDWAFYLVVFGSFLAGGFIFLFLVGISDYAQKKRAVLGKFPTNGKVSIYFEAIRPELRQYFWEADSDELPYSRNQRAMVYQRSKQILAVDLLVQMKISIWKILIGLITQFLHQKLKMMILELGWVKVKILYNISVLNISGTSFGSISPKAIQSFSAGAKKGGFAHNTGEGFSIKIS